MNQIINFLQSLAFLLDYVRIAVAIVFYTSGTLVALILLAAILLFLGKIAAAGWESMREGFRSQPVYTGVLVVLFVFLSSTALFALTNPAGFSEVLKPLVFL